MLIHKNSFLLLIEYVIKNLECLISTVLIFDWEAQFAELEYKQRCKNGKRLMDRIKLYIMRSYITSKLVSE